MPLPSDKLSEFCLKWASGDQNAAAFLLEWAYIVRLADNIADGDSEDTVSDMAQLLTRCLIVNAANPFFQENFAALSSVMANAIMLWNKSEDWKTSPDRKTRMFGFVCRESVEHVTYTVAFLTGGYAHALSVIEELHQMSHATSPETFEEWENE